MTAAYLGAPRRRAPEPAAEPADEPADPGLSAPSYQERAERMQRLRRRREYPPPAAAPAVDPGAEVARLRALRRNREGASE